MPEPIGRCTNLWFNVPKRIARFNVVVFLAEPRSSLISLRSKKPVSGEPRAVFRCSHMHICLYAGDYRTGLASFLCFVPGRKVKGYKPGVSPQCRRQKHSSSSFLCLLGQVFHLPQPPRYSPQATALASHSPQVSPTGKNSQILPSSSSWPPIASNSLLNS